MKRLTVSFISVYVLSMISTCISGCGAKPPGCSGQTVEYPGLKLEIVKLFTLAESRGGSVRSIELDDDRNIYIAGNFSGVIDLDPGTGISNMQSMGEINPDIFLAKYDPEGNNLWGLSWGAGGEEYVLDMRISPDGYIYVFGTYSGSVDFDPGPNVMIATSPGESGRFISRFNTLGGFEWVRTCNADYSTLRLNSMCPVSNGDLAIVGDFKQTVDFDMGQGVYEVSPDQGSSAFLLMLSKEGDFKWVNHWGSEYLIDAIYVSADGQDNIYVTGTFEKKPPPTSFEYLADINRTTLAYGARATMAYIGKFNSTGGAIWWRSWGKFKASCAPNFIGVASDDRVYVSGSFSGNIDFDPGPGTYVQTGNEDFNIFISGFNIDGNFTGGITFTNYSFLTSSVLPHNDGSVYCIGRVTDPIDMDPGPGVMEVVPTERDAEGNSGTTYLLARYSPDGRLIQAGIVANTHGLEPSCLAVDSDGHIFIAGSFYGNPDLDPGPESLVIGYPDETIGVYFAEFTEVP